MTDKKLLWADPKTSDMQRFEATAPWFAALDALGLDPSDLCPSSPLGRDLRPRTFAVSKVVRVTREPQSFSYLVWTKSIISDDPREDDLGSSRPVVGKSEQEAGDAVLLECRLGSGTNAQALSRWLQMWGWKLTAKQRPAEPMVI